MSSVWLRISWWDDGTLVNEILDYVPEVKALVGGMTESLVKVTVSIGFEVSWECIWKWTWIQGFDEVSA